MRPNLNSVLAVKYLAINFGEIISNITFFIFSDRNTALTYAQNHGLNYTPDGRVVTKSDEEYSSVCYPKNLDKYVNGYISHVIFKSNHVCELM